MSSTLVILDLMLMLIVICFNIYNYLFFAQNVSTSIYKAQNTKHTMQLDKANAKIVKTGLHTTQYVPFLDPINLQVKLICVTGNAKSFDGGSTNIKLGFKKVTSDDLTNSTYDRQFYPTIINNTNKFVNELDQLLAQYTELCQRECPSSKVNSFRSIIKNDKNEEVAYYRLKMADKYLTILDINGGSILPLDITHQSLVSGNLNVRGIIISSAGVSLNASFNKVLSVILEPKHMPKLTVTFNEAENEFLDAVKSVNAVQKKSLPASSDVKVKRSRPN